MANNHHLTSLANEVSDPELDQTDFFDVSVSDLHGSCPSVSMFLQHPEDETNECGRRMRSIHNLNNDSLASLPGCESLQQSYQLNIEDLPQPSSAEDNSVDMLTSSFQLNMSIISLSNNDLTKTEEETQYHSNDRHPSMISPNPLDDEGHPSGRCVMKGRIIPESQVQHDYIHQIPPSPSFMQQALDINESLRVVQQRLLRSMERSRETRESLDRVGGILAKHILQKRSSGINPSHPSMFDCDTML